MEKAFFETPAGFVGVCWGMAGLVALNLPAPTLYEAEMVLRACLDSMPGKSRSCREAPLESLDVNRLEGEINDYFRGKKAPLSFPVDWSRFTDFQKKVLQQVYAVPWGRTISYGRLAAAAGSPRGARAAGGAVGSNRVLLVVPCHRVIAQDGTIGGFGGGLDWKRRLLKMEGIDIY